MVPIRERRVGLVDEGLHLFDEKLEVVVAEEVFFAHSLALRILLQRGRIAVEDILGEVFLTPRTGGVGNADDDAVLDLPLPEKAAKDFVDAPFLVVEHLFGVEKVLAVAHVDDGVLFLRRVVVRKPDIDVSRRDKSGVGFKTRVEIEASRRDVGLVGISLAGLPGAAFRLHLSSASHTVQHLDRLGEVHGLFLLLPLDIGGDLAAVCLVGRKGIERLLLEFQGFLQRVHENPLHIVVDVDGGVDSVVGRVVVQTFLGIGERSEVVHVCYVLLRVRVGLQACVESFDDGTGVDVGKDHVVSARSDGAEEDLDAGGLRQLAHRYNVVIDGLVGIIGLGSHVLAKIVGPRHNRNGLGLETDDILHEAGKHLACGLSADSATCEVVLLEEVGVVVVPEVGDRVAH